MIEVWIVLGLLIAAIVTGIGAVYALASFNLFWTIVAEGEIRVVMCFKRPVRPLLQYTGYKMDGWTVVEGEEELSPLRRLLRRLFGGLRWVGIPLFRTVYDYIFRWATIRMSTDPEGPAEVIVRREQRLHHIFAKQALYVIEVVAVETKGMVPLNIRLVFTACCVNPLKALFTIQDWLITLANLILPHLRVIVADQQFEELISKRGTVLTAIKAELEKALDGAKMVEKFKEDFGISITNFDLSDIGATNPQHAEIAIREWTAQQDKKARIVAAEANKEAAIIEAKGQKKAAITVAEGRKEALAMVAKTMAQHKQGPYLATLDAYRDMAKDGKLVIAPGVNALFEDAARFLRHPPETPANPKTKAP